MERQHIALRPIVERNAGSGIKQTDNGADSSRRVAGASGRRWRSLPVSVMLKVENRGAFDFFARMGSDRHCAGVQRDFRVPAIAGSLNQYDERLALVWSEGGAA